MIGVDLSKAVQRRRGENAEPLSPFSGAVRQCRHGKPSDWVQPSSLTGLIAGNPQYLYNSR